MRAAVFSDIHGNLIGLEAVLSAIKYIGNIDVVISAGDMLGGGGGHEDVIELLIENQVKMIKGNHEEGDLDIEKTLEVVPEAHKDWVTQTHRWLERNLSPSSWKLISELPLTSVVEHCANQSFLVCHAAPTDTRAMVCGKGVPRSELVRSFGSLPHQVIAHGHFHQHQVQMLGSKLIVNVGSVGLRFDGLSAFSVIEYVNDRWIIEQYEVPYDRNDEMTLMTARGVPESMYDLIHYPVATGPSQG